jgi:TetR/AcrR family fatty acid metabolism transcriptional regulator
MSGLVSAASPYRKPEKVEAIISAAYTAIAKKGYAQVSMRDIAFEAGVNKSILHYYFKDKDELILQVFRSLHDKFLEIIRRAADLQANIEEKFTVGFREFRKFTEEEPKWFIVTMELIIQLLRRPEGRKEVFSLYKEIKGSLADALLEAKKRGEFQVDLDEGILASLIIAVVNGLALQFIVDSKATDFSKAYFYFGRMLDDFLECASD